MIFFLNADIAYVVLSAAFLLTILALLAPGSGFLEIGALVSLMVVVYAVVNLPVNSWAIALLLIGVVAVIVTLRRTRAWYFIVGSILLLLVGMLFLFRGPGLLIGVDPLLALIVSSSMGTFIWIIGRNIFKASRQRPQADLNNLIGQIGTVVTDVKKKGSVYVGGENWSAVSDEPISSGSQVVVKERMGLVLKVDKLKETKNK